MFIDLRFEHRYDKSYPSAITIIISDKCSISRVKVPARYCVLGMYLITENYEIMISNTSRSALIPGFCLLRIYMESC
ncbi:uncharacterized protein OCT59_026677 [Rhizophagus irregularis]|uniref:uncharacterized protein n=1 Tax=Rhizophagus irregularis TaxID=588596 RepID=UPI00332A8320|nr:hypothetical protein OCT59_026677 [Rhizophagus irregularis]